MRSPRALLVFHGALLLLAGLLTGIPFTLALTEGWGADAARAWRVAHTSLVMGGILYLAIAAVVDALVLGPTSRKVLTWALVATAYVFSSGLVLGAAIGERGLEPGGTAVGVLIFVAFALSVLALFVAVGILCVGAYAALRSSHGS